MLSRALLAASACSCLILCVAADVRETNHSHVLYIGTYTSHGSKGIYSATFDERTGSISQPTLAATAADPSFLALHPKLPILYAVNEGSSKVSSFSIAAPGRLTPLNHVPSPGGPCHLALDRTGRMLLVANYGSGSFASFPVLPDGTIGTRSALVQFSGSGPNRERQEAPHAHFAAFTADNLHALVTDLGTDRIGSYRVHPETAGVEPVTPEFTADNPGSGPRHLVFSPDNRTVYVLNEIQCTITRFAFDAHAGALREIDTVSVLPPGFKGKSTAAEIVIGPGGHWLMASNRGDDSIVVLRIDRDGGLHQIERVSSGGHTPRSFTLDHSGRWMLAANQDSGNICSFRVDSASGRLTQTSHAVNVDSPVCLLLGRE